MYVYKIEIQLFKEDGAYNGYLLSKEKQNCNDEWGICSIFTAKTLGDVLKWADGLKDIYKE